jgi:Acyl-CoA reductase (LuxC)
MANRMNLPNYFLADLPPEAALNGAVITEACQTLKRNREKYLATRSTPGLVELLCEVAERWLQPEYPFRKLALQNGPAATGFSAATLASGLDAFFHQLTPEQFQALLAQDLGHAKRLDEIGSNNAEEKFRRGAIAIGPELLAHITAGNIPSPTLASIVLGVLTRSAQFVKCASGASLVPRLFAHSLYDAEPKLGACLEIAEWRGGHAHLEQALFDEVDCVTATGSDEALGAIRHRLPARVRFVQHGHRVSFGYVAAAALSGFNSKKVAARAATDVVAWNQLGCLSPHVIYVEHGGVVGAESFAEMLAEELARREETEPRGDLSTEAAATIASRRAFYEVRAAHSPETRFWQSRNSTAWTVVYEADPQFQFSCLNRFVYVKRVKDLTEALRSADSVQGKVSTVGLAAPEEQARELAIQLARWGATRVCPLGQMQTPPLTWRHDGRPALADLVVWTDLEL